MLKRSGDTPEDLAERPLPAAARFLADWIVLALVPLVVRLHLAAAAVMSVVSELAAGLTPLFAGQGLDLSD